MAGFAGSAFHAGDLGCNEDAVTRRVALDQTAHSDDLGADLMALHQGSPWETIPFDDIAAADTACDDFREDLVGIGFGRWRLLKPDVTVVVPHRDFHGAFLQQIRSMAMPETEDKEEIARRSG